MLQLFRNNQPIVALLLLGLLALLRLGALYNPPEAVLYNSGLASDMIYALVGGATGWLPNLLSALLVFVQALLVNRLVTNFQIAPENTYFPALFYIILTSFSPTLQWLSPALIAITVLFIILNQLYDSYKPVGAADIAFNIGFWIAVGSLVYSSFWVFLVLGIIGLQIMRAFHPEEVIILFIGFFVPYFLIGVGYFWFTGFDGLWVLFIKREILAHIGFLYFKISWTWEVVFTLVVWLAALLAAFYSSSQFFNRLSNLMERCMRLLFWTLGIAFVSVVFQNKMGIDHLFMFAIPLGVFTALNFMLIQNRQYAEFGFLTLLLVTVAYQYQAPVLMLLAK